LSGYPWVSKIPLLKYLFAQDNKDHQEDEIVFAITPHIVRGREVTEENARVIEVGTGSSTELRRKQPAAAVARAGRPSEP
jgi:general secretion pathway protein D